MLGKNLTILFEQIKLSSTLRHKLSYALIVGTGSILSITLEGD